MEHTHEYLHEHGIAHTQLDRLIGRRIGICHNMQPDELFGKLLTEPKQNFGIHPGNIIGFTPVPQKDGIVCISVGRAV